MTPKQAETFLYNVLDLTKIWPYSEFSLCSVGKFVLNENPQYDFAEIEQIASSLLIAPPTSISVSTTDDCLSTVNHCKSSPSCQNRLKCIPTTVPGIMHLFDHTAETYSFVCNDTCSRFDSPPTSAPYDQATTNAPQTNASI